MTPRNLANMAGVGQCKYILITNSDGGIINDPIFIYASKRIRIEISLADSDVLLWAQGVAVNTNFDVKICE